MKKILVDIWRRSSWLLCILRPLLYVLHLVRSLTAMLIEMINLLANEGLKLRMEYCGKEVIVHGRPNITGISCLLLGDNVHIGRGAYMRCEGGVHIGNNTHISRNLTLYSIQHNIEGSRLPYDEQQLKEAVHIGENVWIGMNVSILPGVRIGDGAIIGMGTVVATDVEAMQIVAGHGFREIGARNTDHYSKLNEDRSFGGPSGM